MPEDGPFVVNKACREQKLERVVVFNDRAEVRRILQCGLKPGLNEVHIENVTNRIINDSVRVDGRGDGIIHDVQLRDTPAIHEDTDSPLAADLRVRVDDKIKEVHLLQDRETVLKRRIEILDRIVGEVGGNVVSHPEKKEPFTISQETLENLTKFFSYYEESSVRTRTEERNVSKRLEKAERELAALKTTLDREKSDNNMHHYTKSIVVFLESKNGGQVELEITYQVRGARWSPSYDIRVETAGKQSLKITYYGNISQSTQEDWSNASLVLSTAQPCLGGQLPELDVIEAVFHRPPPPRRMYSSPRAGGMFGVSSTCEVDTAQALGSVLDGPPMKFGVSAVAPVQPHVLNTEFTVSKTAAIPSDGAEHKVIIGIINLDPILVHECVPSKNTSAFLTASAVNASELPFLLGDAAVYLNNSFVSKTSMKNVSPGERFSCSLGVDTALQIEYKPVKKYHEQVGIIAKVSSTVHDQVIIVKNTRSEQVLLTIKESIPRSTDEKIRIKLISPEVSSLDETKSSGDLIAVAELPKEGAKMMGDGSLEWTHLIPGGKSNELHVKWAVEHPVNETVEFVKAH